MITSRVEGEGTAAPQPPRAGRPWVIPLVVLVAIAAALVAVRVLSSDDHAVPTSVPGSTVATTAKSGGAKDAVGIDRLLAGIPQSGLVLGAPDAAVRIVEYGDLQCPYCRQAAMTVVPEVIDQLVRPGVASIEFRPLQFIGPDSRRGARLVLHAGEQGKGWHTIENLYRIQGPENAGWLNAATVNGLIITLGLDAAKTNAAFADPALDAKLASIDEQARKDGVRATPTFVVHGPKGTKTLDTEQLPTLTEIQAAVESVR